MIKGETVLNLVDNFSSDFGFETFIFQPQLYQAILDDPETTVISEKESEAFIRRNNTKITIISSLPISQSGTEILH